MSSELWCGVRGVRGVRGVKEERAKGAASVVCGVGKGKKVVPLCREFGDGRCVTANSQAGALAAEELWRSYRGVTSLVQRSALVVGFDR